ncbi:MAG: hypothetical protein ACQEXB_24330 [Bacillota bacterium]
MNPKGVLDSLQLAALGGLITGFILDVVFLSTLNVLSIVGIAFCSYMTFNYNELFWELVEKVNRK